ncbi:DUF6350 family protein, partial [Kitasatospora sp. NPDC059571]|uniref:cell division protein PerM n=1 Tax=Kitasatospora sp. NPDC059571 TaxID=3346871 RepID=UPI003680D461
MTQLMGRPILVLPEDVGSRSVLADVLAGARTALLALAVIAVPVLGLWVLTPYPDVTAAGALRLACALWLLGHAAPLTRGPAGVPFTLTPLLLTSVTLLLLRRAGARAARSGRPSGRRARGASWRAVLGVGAGYLGVGALAVADCAGAQAFLRARAVPDLVAVAAVAGAGLAWGACAATGLPRLALPAALTALAGRRPAPADTGDAYQGDGTGPAGVAPVVAGAASAGLLGLVAGGGVLLLAAIAAGRAGESAAALADGPAGLLGVLLACALLLPNAVVWAAAYALGPGFAVGADVLASPLGGRSGPMPDFPLLALLPDPGPAAGPGWRLVVGVLPLLAGAVPALLLGRAAAGVARRPRHAGPAAPWRAGTGVLAAAATALATGAAG